MFIPNKTALYATQMAKPSVFSVKSILAEWFLETAIQELNEEIRAVIDEIEPQMCEM